MNSDFAVISGITCMIAVPLCAAVVLLGVLYYFLKRRFKDAFMSLLLFLPISLMAAWAVFWLKVVSAVGYRTIEGWGGSFIDWMIF